MLEELWADDLEAHAAGLAHHFGQAEAVLGDEKLMHYSRLAGEKALANYAYEQAINFFERGLESRKATPLDKVTADMTFGLGLARMAAAERHHFIEAVGTIRQAFDYYERVGDVSKAVEVANTPITPLAGQPSGAQDMLQRALSKVPPNSLQAGQLWCNLGRRLGIESGNYEEARTAFNNALNIAGSLDDDALKARANIDSSQVDFLNGNWTGARTHDRAHGDPPEPGAAPSTRLRGARVLERLPDHERRVSGERRHRRGQVEVRRRREGPAGGRGPLLAGAGA